MTTVTDLQRMSAVSDFRASRPEIGVGSQAPESPEERGPYMAETLRHDVATPMTSSVTPTTPAVRAPEPTAPPAPAVFVPPIRARQPRTRVQTAPARQAPRPAATPVRQPAAAVTPVRQTVRPDQLRTRHPRRVAGPVLGVVAGGSVLGLAVLGYLAGAGAFGEQAAQYTAIGVALLFLALVMTLVVKVKKAFGK